MRVVDFLYLCTLYTTAMFFKNVPEAMLRGEASHDAIKLVAKALPYVGLLCIVPMLEEDLRSALVWWDTARGAKVKSEVRSARPDVGPSAWTLHPVPGL